MTNNSLKSEPNKIIESPLSPLLNANDYNIHKQQISLSARESNDASKSNTGNNSKFTYDTIINIDDAIIDDNI